MKTKFVAPILLMASLATFGNNTMASDELAGALLGAGTGAVLGNVVGGHDGAIVGGFIGAMLGVAVADDDDGRPGMRPPHRVIYAPPPVTVYQAPRVRYAQPIIVAPPPPRYGHFERDQRRDGRRDHDRDGWRDDRGHSSGDRWDRGGW